MGTALAVTVGQGTAGAALAITPEAVARLASGSGSPPPRWLVRLLGGRMALQAVVLHRVRRTRRSDRGRAYRLAAGVDLLHAASMVGAAAAFPRYRRPALLSGAMALAAAGLEAVTA